jgi:t-SNARE complex subunit (syntaxin)
MLGDVEEDIDQANNRMDVVMKKMERILKTKSRWKILTILVLAVIFFVLLWIVLSGV